MVIRLILECIKREESEPVERVRKLIVVLGVLFLPLSTILYLREILNYIEIWTPGTWAMRPMPVEYFLVWMTFVMIDILYQFNKLSKMAESEI